MTPYEVELGFVRPWWLDEPPAGTSSADVTAPTLSPTLGFWFTESRPFSVYFTGSTTEANGTLYAIASNSATPPSVAQIQAGNDSSSSAAIHAQNWTVTSTSLFNILYLGGANPDPFGGLEPNTTYYVYLQQQDAAGNDSVVYELGQITTQDHEPSAVSTGETTGAGSYRPGSNVGSYYWVVDQSATPPSTAQIQAGQGSDGAAADDAGNATITVANSQGRESITATGLTLGVTYYLYVQHLTASGVESPVFLAGSFTTAAPFEGKSGLTFSLGLGM